jgi:hypothetical protein
MKNNVWAVTDISTRTSRHGGVIEQLSLINTYSGARATTYLDSQNRNYQYWHSVLNNRPDAQLIRGLTTKTHNGKLLINADSRPEVLWTGPREQLDQVLREYWGVQGKNTYSNLFD